MDQKDVSSRIKIEIGAWLKTSRICAGISLGEAAHVLNVKPDRLQRVEDGKTGIPCSDLTKLVTLYRIPGDAVAQKMVEVQVQFLK